MSVQTIATIIFFAVYGINFFWGFPSAGVILAVSALVIAIAILVGR